MNDEAKLVLVVSILRDPFATYEDLDRRERKALKALAEGKASRDLAVALDVSVRTAYNIVDRALLKISKVEKKMIRRDDVTGMVFTMLRKAIRNGRKK